MAFSVQKIRGSLLVAAAKGGVGKTATATSLAACWAERGIATLVVDTDPQASATRALGLDPAATGEGRGLVEAIAHGESLRVFDSPGRPNLGVVPAGMETRHGSTHLVTAADGPARFVGAFDELGDRWEVKVFDSPPTVLGSRLSEVVLCASETLVAPCSANVEDIEGLRGLGGVCEALDAGILVLGVAMTRVPAAATRRRADALRVVGELLDGFSAPFSTVVRDAPAAWNAAMTAGMLPHEFGRANRPARRGVPRNAAGLAQDIERFADEVWATFSEVRDLLHGEPEAA